MVGGAAPTVPDSLAVGVVAYKRPDRLRRLLDSVPASVDRVIVADNGPASEDTASLYARSYPFRLSVLDLAVGAGLGRCRNRIVDALDEPYLLMADDDHELTPDLAVLYEQLRERPGLGGIAGSIIEPDRGRLWQSAKDFEVRPETQELVRSANLTDKTIERVAGAPLVPFDFVPYPTLYRRECLAAYSWDPAIRQRRVHADFYFVHYRDTDWTFAINPGVHFYHYPGGDEDYEADREAPADIVGAEAYFQTKWGLQLTGRKQFWYDTDRPV